MTTRKDLAQGVTVYVTRSADNSSIVYDVEVSKPAVVQFTADFSGSKNVGLVGLPSLANTVNINPFERKTVASLRIIDASQGSSIRTRYGWKEGPIDQDTARQLAEKDGIVIQSQLATARSLRLDADSLTLADVERVCKTNGIAFIDLEFPPVLASLQNKPTTSSSPVVTWRRFTDFLPPGFSIIEDGTTPLDIRQGTLGDCWLLSALSCLAEFPAQVEALFRTAATAAPRLSPSPSGVYSVRLCVSGEWTDVRLDDFIPCSPLGGPVYARNHGNELWVLLVEKAFAKAMGTYSALEGGFAYEALMNLTGCPTSKYYFDDPAVAALIKSGEMFDKLLQLDASDCLIAASTSGEDVWSGVGGAPVGGPGLVTGHAYSILQVKRSSRGHRLFELRNPWGKFEWNGDWSDASPLWTPDLKSELHPSLDPDDGKFWMSYEDFQKYFNAINVCRLHPTGQPGTQWRELRRKGRFLYDGSRVQSTMYVLRTTSVSSSCWLSLHQADERIIGSKKYIDFGITVLRQNKDGSRTVVASTGIEVDRQSQLELINLPAGEYYIVPITTGCQFELATIMSSERNKRPSLFTADGDFTPAADFAIRKVFDSLDEDLDCLLKRGEASAFLMATESQEISDKVWSWIMRSFDSADNGLTPDGFVSLYKWMYNTAGKDESVIWKDLKYFGYNDSLEETGGRSFVVSIHSDIDAVELLRVPFDAKIYEDAVELPVVQQGVRKDVFNGKITQFTLKSGYWGVSVAVRNNSSSPQTVSVDCSSATNAISHRHALKADITLGPGEVEIAHHIMPKTQEKWSYGVSLALGPA